MTFAFLIISQHFDLPAIIFTHVAKIFACLDVSDQKNKQIC